MANKTLPTLAASTIVAGTDLLLSRQAGTSDTKTTVDQLMTFINTNVTPTVANEATDTTCFPLFVTAATGALGLKTNATLTFNSNTGAFGTAAHTITSASATSLVVGPNGTTDPVWVVDGSTATQAAGLKLTGAVAAGTVALAVTSSGSNAGLSISSKGTGAVTFAAGSSGFTFTATGGAFNVNSVTGAVFQIAGTNNVQFLATQALFSPNTSATAANPRFGFTGAANTTLTASADFNNVYFNMGQTNQHATGAITTQRDFRITPMTHTAVGASVITDAYGLYIDSGPVASTNVTMTNTWAVGMGGKLQVNTTDATTAITSFTQVAGSSYLGMNWTAGATTGVRFSVVGYGAHSGNGDITSTGHLGGVLGYAQKTGTGTDALVVGVEGRVGALTASGTITTAAAVLATFDTDTEDAGQITDAVGFYLPAQSDSAHITGTKYAFLNNNTDWILRTNGASTLFGKITQDQTITAPGTTGARTINKPTGRVNFAAGATSLVVTNSLVTANTDVYVQQNTLDAVMLNCYAIAGSGSFTIYAVGTPAAEVAVKFWIVN
jgi:hypothetical protein